MLSILSYVIQFYPRLSYVILCYPVLSYVLLCYPIYSPVGVHFATASFDRTAQLWSCDATYPIRLFAGHNSSVDVSTLYVCIW